MEEEKDKKWVKKGNFLANGKSLNEFIKNFKHSLPIDRDVKKFLKFVNVRFICLYLFVFYRSYFDCAIRLAFLNLHLLIRLNF